MRGANPYRSRLAAPGAFSSDYFSARERFRRAAQQRQWSLESYAVEGRGPRGEELTIDVACSPGTGAERTLVISSGLHGVEAFLGAAVQVALLEDHATVPNWPWRYVFLHGLNPYGFAWLRRVDECNVDLNRNFLFEGEPYRGAPPAYVDLDPFLNPRRPPGRWPPFLPRALWEIARRGLPTLREAVATGQYEFPQGLFFGGWGPSGTQQVLADNLHRCLAGSQQVIHLDFHTGLGTRGAWKILVDGPLSEPMIAWLQATFGASSFETTDNSTIAYRVRGSLGRWCAAHGLARDYRYLCAEFGTYGPLAVVAGLRAENQAHHWGDPGSPSTRRAKQRLAELFCPRDVSWRSWALEQGIGLARRVQLPTSGESTSFFG